MGGMAKYACGTIAAAGRTVGCSRGVAPARWDFMPLRGHWTWISRACGRGPGVSILPIATNSAKVSA